MHGIIFRQLQQFVIKNYDTGQWFTLIEAAKVSEVTKLPTGVILESFGEFILCHCLKYTMLPLTQIGAFWIYLKIRRRRFIKQFGLPTKVQHLLSFIVCESQRIKLK